jgi:hypothetical protein
LKEAMLTNKIFIMATVATSLLAGCASRPLKPMTQEEYTQYSVDYVGISKCGELGYMDTELASFGLSQMRSSLTYYSYDAARMAANFKHMQTQTPTQENCNKVAMQIHDLKRRVATNQQNSAVQQQQLQSILNNSPKQTYCNKFGSQVMCSTY